MAGTVKVEVPAGTKEEIKKQLEGVIKDLDKVQIDPNKSVQDLHSTEAMWKVSYDTSD